jgi:tetratricopeptide (TPR) repeat protein
VLVLHGIFGPRATAQGAPPDRPAGLVVKLRGNGARTPGHATGRLLRELARQALLSAARDEFGLSTRDESLGESIAPDDASRVFDVSVAAIEPRGLVINVAQNFPGGRTKPLAEYRLDYPPEELIERLAARAHELSTREFVELLKQAGIRGAAAKTVEKGATDARIEANLARFDPIAQYAAARALHAEIRAKGESPERLAALARAYAHLSSLNDYLWHPLHKVFQARGLLYAERLMKRTGASPVARRTRAYVRALTGLHKAALGDLAAAGVPDAKTPAWVTTIENFCRGNEQALRKEAEQAEGASLAEYLRFLMSMYSSSDRRRIDAATRLVGEEPGCMVGFDVLVSNAPLGIQRTGCQLQFTAFAQTLRTELGEMEGLPKLLQTLIETPAGELSEEMEWRKNLIAALHEAGRADKDRGEPSLGGLAFLTREISFLHAARQLDFEWLTLGIDPGETHAAIRPTFDKHPLEDYLDYMVRDYAASAAALNSLWTIHGMLDLSLASDDLQQSLSSLFPEVGPEKSNILEFGDQIARNGDRLVFDLFRTLQWRTNAPTRIAAVTSLRDVNPESPLAIAAVINHDWTSVEKSAAEIEMKFKDSLDVIIALGKQYVRLERSDDAERCLKRRIDLLPEHEAYDSLAGLYKDRGDDENWMKTLVASLELPSQGLEHTEVHIALAEHYMGRKQWENARPHVEQAAPAYSSGALQIASAFHELTGDMRQAEAYQRADSERYDPNRMHWYGWCRRTNQGDLDAARQLAEAFLEEGRQSPSLETHRYSGLFAQLEGRPEAALDAYRAAATAAKEPVYYVRAALVAAQLGKNQARDSLLREAYDVGANVNGGHFQLIRVLRACLAAGPKAELDEKLVEWAIRSRHGEMGYATAALYFVGRFQALRGRDTDAVRYLQRAATSPAYLSDCAILAARELHDRGIAIGERREFELDAGSHDAIRTCKKAKARISARKYEEALKILDALIEAHPEFPEGPLRRGQCLKQLGRLEEAEAYFNRAVELVPDCAEFLHERGHFLECHGEYARAAADYERALELEPDFGPCRNNLIFLKAACPDPAMRNGPQAVKLARRLQEDVDMPLSVRLVTLAVALAADGKFDEAVRVQTNAIAIVPPGWKKSMEDRLQLFQRKEPYHRKPGWWRVAP